MSVTVALWALRLQHIERLARSAAVLRPRDIVVAGTGQAEESLRALITEWAHAGRPDHTALQPILIPDPAGFNVEVETSGCNWPPSE